MIYTFIYNLSSIYHLLQIVRETKSVTLANLQVKYEG